MDGSGNRLVQLLLGITVAESKLALEATRHFLNPMVLSCGVHHPALDSLWPCRAQLRCGWVGGPTRRVLGFKGCYLLIS